MTELLRRKYAICANTNGDWRMISIGSWLIGKADVKADSMAAASSS